MTRYFHGALAATAIAALAACAQPSTSGHTFAQQDARQPMRVEMATVVAIRDVRIEQNQHTGLGVSQ